MATSCPFHFPALAELVGRRTLLLVHRWAQVHLLRGSRNVSWEVVMPLVLHWVGDKAYMCNYTGPQTYRTSNLQVVVVIVLSESSSLYHEQL